MKHINYPKTVQYRNVVSNIIKATNFVGLDDNGDAIYDYTKEKPTLKFKGTVKLHGTNAAVCFNDSEGVYVQSRNNAFSLDKAESHMGFTFLVKNKKQLFLNIFDAVKEQANINTSTDTITIYGEWAGSGVQKLVSISKLKKSFYIFGCKISRPNDPDFTSYWVDISDMRFPQSDNVWCINEFKTYEIDIDFNNPALVQNRFIELIKEIEDECPVSKYFFDEVMSDNTAYEENGKIWFDKENGFTNDLKKELESQFKEIRKELPNGVNYIKFNME